VQNLAQKINDFFRSVSEQIPPLDTSHPILALECDVPDQYLVSVADMEKRLLGLKVHKSTGPDQIPAWVLHDFAHVLAGPLASIVNDSIREGSFPKEWKVANTVPLPKVHPPRCIRSDLRPISITPVAAKAVEYFPVKMVSDSIMEHLDPNQYGGIKNSSTALALIRIIDYIASAVDKSPSCVRMLLCDFSEAFDLVDHTIVINKLHSLGVHECLVKWCANFLSGRTQRVKIGNFTSPTVEMHAGCPQGTLLGPLAFVAHINDLQPEGKVVTIKYVDDTSVLCTTDGDDDNTMQQVCSYLNDWACHNNMVFNVKKTKEMVFSFGQRSTALPVSIGDAMIEQVEEAKILGVTIQSDLKWNSHVINMVKKANKRLYLLRLCKRAGVQAKHLVGIYTSVIRSLLEYCCMVWHPSLPAYLSQDIERVQKRALRVIFPEDDYEASLVQANIETLHDRREMLCARLFKQMCVPGHKLNDLIPSPNSDYDLRNNRIPHVIAHTSRYLNTFVPYCIRKSQ
jgi:hypothetical protein